MLELPSSGGLHPSVLLLLKKAIHFYLLNLLLFGVFCNMWLKLGLVYLDLWPSKLLVDIQEDYWLKVVVGGT